MNNKYKVVVKFFN